MKKFHFLRSLFIFFLLVYFLFLVLARAPATWAAWTLHQALPNLWLSSVEGTVWRGKATSAQVDIGQAVLPLGELTWTVKPWSLLSGKVCVDVATELPRQQMSGLLCRGLSGKNRIRNFNLDAPVSVLKELLPFQANGAISLQVQNALIDDAATIEELDARMSWQQARAYGGESWLNLGSFAAKAREDGKGGLSAQIFDLEGPYKSELSGVWNKSDDWVFRGTIAPQEGASKLVTQALAILGEEQGDGAYLVQWP
jgi:general secretion pathway protein N